MTCLVLHVEALVLALDGGTRLQLESSLLVFSYMCIQSFTWCD